MNSATQFDPHPDAESLNAFVEQSLAERERVQILAHLAVCGRCRRVVTLAQDMAAAAEVVSTAAVETFQPARKSASWLWNWRHAWIPATALAVLIAAALFVHMRQQQPGQETATVTLPAAPQIAENAPAASSPKQMVAGETKTTAPAGVANQSIGGRKATEPDEVVALSRAEPVRSEKMQAPLAVGRHGAEQLAKAAGISGPVPAQQEPEASLGPVRSATSWKQQLGGAAEASSVAARPGHTEPLGMATAAKTRLDLATASIAAKVKSQPGINANLRVVEKEAASPDLNLMQAQMIRLPSGLPSVSTASANHRTLALDAAGALFLRENLGDHWEQVPSQWTGRAVKVRLQQAPGSANSPAAASSPVTPAFEIVNDVGQEWVSPDGSTWIRK